MTQRPSFSRSRLTVKTLYAEGPDQALNEEAYDLSEAHYIRSLKEKVFEFLKCNALINKEDRPCKVRAF